MKKVYLLLAALAILPSMANAKDEPVYVSPPHAMNNGDGAPTDYMRQVIFRNKKCDLQIEGASNMREYLYTPSPYGMQMRGCAAKLLNNQFLVIYFYGGQYVEERMPYGLFKYGTLDSKGIITVGDKLL